MAQPTATAAIAAVAPSIGPAVVTLFGQEIPIFALALSMLGLLLARTIAPVSRRKLSRGQEIALTILLMIVLLLIVTGQFSGGRPLGSGMAVIWGIGLGMSGLLSIEFFGTWVMDTIRRMLYAAADVKPPSQDPPQDTQP